VPALVAQAREAGVPIVFFQEAHRRDLVDFGRELDGAEGVHLLEGDPGTEIAAALGVRPDHYAIRNRRYSWFFGTELEILLKGLQGGASASIRDCERDPPVRVRRSRPSTDQDL